MLFLELNLDKFGFILPNKNRMKERDGWERFHESCDDQIVSEDHEEWRKEVWMNERGNVLINKEERRNQMESCGLMLDHLLVVRASNLSKSLVEWVLKCFESIFNEIEEKRKNLIDF